MNQLPRRPRRLAEIYPRRARPLFYLTICTAERRRILAECPVHMRFIEFAQASPEKADAWVGRYVLMPDHIHVFVSAEGSRAVSRWVASLKNYFSSRWRKDGLSGPHWQEGFFDHVLRGSESYAQKWAYVEANPVRAGLVAKPEDWPFAGEMHPIQWD